MEPISDSIILPWGDQGDGTYRNPILKSDFSDPDVIRVGSDFFMVASDFHFVGMQVLHSMDLVNWEIVGQVFNRLSMDEKYDQMNGYGQGTWAPAIAHHDGEFYLYVCTPFDGLFLWRAKNARGPWSEMITVKKVERWEDPCPFWDEDGQAYLVHSHKGAGPLILHKMSDDGTRLLDDGMEIYRGPTAEGPKVYKRAGYYFIVLPEGGVATGGQTVLRSKNIYGPYERRQVLPDGSPHQGSLIELENGQAWFIGFKSTGYLGRITYLQPVRWGEDHWPIFGDNGRPADRWKKPDVGGSFPIIRPRTGDEFDEPMLSPIWQWNHNPINEKWSLTDRPGWLRLKGAPAQTLATARNTLTQKLWDETGTINLKMDTANMTDGLSAGFTFISGDQFGWIGVKQQRGRRQIAWEGGDGPPVSGNEVWLRGTHTGDVSKLLYSFDGKNFIDSGQKFQLAFKFWKGARPAIFCFGTGGGWVDIDYFHYTHGEPAGA